jgi:hypothetical protein
MQASDDRAREQLKRESAKAEFSSWWKERKDIARERKIRKYSEEKTKRQREGSRTKILWKRERGVERG